VARRSFYVGRYTCPIPNIVAVDLADVSNEKGVERIDQLLSRKRTQDTAILD
jgi:hypothetical protein